MFATLEEAIGDVTISTTQELAAALVLADRLAATISAAVGEIERAGLHQLDGAVSMAAWLAHHGRMSLPAAASLASTARRLQDLPSVRDAWSAGTLSRDHAGVIARGVTPAVSRLFEEAADVMVPLVSPLRVAAAVIAVRRWNSLAMATVDAGEHAPPAESAGFQLDRTFDGTWHGDLTLAADDAEVVCTALDRAMDTAPPIDGEPCRTRAQRRADALVDVCRYFLDHDRPEPSPRKRRISARRRSRPHLNMVTTSDDLLAEGGTGQSLVTGQAIDTAFLRQIACDCTLHRVLTGADGEILQYGRSQRVVPPALFHAIVVRDHHCRYPGCDRPPDWCDAHHLRHWLDHGLTDLDNCVLLCRRHHRRLHQPGHEAALSPDGTLTISTPSGATITSDPPLRVLLAPIPIRAGP